MQRRPVVNDINSIGPAVTVLAGFEASTADSNQAYRKPPREDVMAEDHGPAIKDDEQYEALRREGASKEKAARIANTDRQTAAERGGEAGSYEDWTKDELESRAAELDIDGRSNMDKDQLIDALRNH